MSSDSFFFQPEFCLFNYLKHLLDSKLNLYIYHIKFVSSGGYRHFLVIHSTEIQDDGTFKGSLL